MTTKTKALSLHELHEQRERLVRRADVIRSRLLRTIDALDERRHQVQEIGHHAKRLAMPAAGILVGAVVVAAGAVFAIRTIVERRRERAFSYRLAKAIAPFRAETKPSFWREALRKLAIAALTMLTSELARRSAKALVDGRTIGFLPAHTGGPSMPPAPHESRLLGK